MNNEPVAWLLFSDGDENYPQYTKSYKQMREWETYLGDNQRIEPHYTHPDNLGLALSIIDQQKIEIEELKAELEKSAEVNRLLAEDIGYEQ